jgi:hypothetical protein
MAEGQSVTPGTAARREPYSHLRALGPHNLPETFSLAGIEYRLVQTFKHDFFAASGLYQGAAGRIVLKMGRCVTFCGLPTSWIGRWLVAREVRFYSQVQDLSGVPRLLGQVSPLAFAHEFVPGHNLLRHELVNDDFFPGLMQLLNTLHARGIAYVDLEKRENIIVGDDGRPYLIDFQISWQWPWRIGRGGWLARWLFNRFRAADLYHLRKHIRRCRPDQMNREQIQQSRRVGPLIRLHRTLFRPLTLLRRRILAHVERVRARARSQVPPESK